MITSKEHQISASLRASLPVPALPNVFTLEITTTCNNFCSGCANVELSRDKPGRKNTNVYMQNWRYVLNKIAIQTNRNAIIRLSGGEPTLHPEFIEIIEHLNKLELSFAILTTGRWNSKIKRTIFNTLKNQPLFLGMLVSLHGHNAITHCAFTESPLKTFDETCLNISSATNNGIGVFTNTVITNLNFTKIREIALLSKKLGAGMAVFNRFIGKDHPLLPDIDQTQHAVKQVQKLKDEDQSCRIGNSLPKCFVPYSAYATPAGYELCHISPSGKVRPDNFSHFEFGNIFEQDLYQIWHSEKSYFFRNCFPSSCLDCAALPSCRGGLKSLSVESGIPQGDPLMLGTLSFEHIQNWDDDKEKTQNKTLLALTSD